MKIENFEIDEEDVIEGCLRYRKKQLEKWNEPFFENELKIINKILNYEK